MANIHNAVGITARDIWEYDTRTLTNLDDRLKVFNIGNMVNGYYIYDDFEKENPFDREDVYGYYKGNLQVIRKSWTLKYGNAWIEDDSIVFKAGATPITQISHPSSLYYGTWIIKFRNRATPSSDMFAFYPLYVNGYNYVDIQNHVGANQWILHKLVNNSGAYVDSYSGATTDTDWHILYVKADESGNWTVLLDGTEILSGSITDFSSCSSIRIENRLDVQVELDFVKVY